MFLMYSVLLTTGLGQSAVYTRAYIEFFFLSVEMGLPELLTNDECLKNVADRTHLCSKHVLRVGFTLY